MSSVFHPREAELKCLTRLQVNPAYIPFNDNWLLDELVGFYPRQGFAANQRVGISVYLEYVDITVYLEVNDPTGISPNGDCIRFQFWMDRFTNGAAVNILDLYESQSLSCKTLFPAKEENRTRFLLLAEFDQEVKVLQYPAPTVPGELTVSLKKLHRMRVQVKRQVDFTTVSYGDFRDIQNNCFFMAIGRCTLSPTNPTVYPFTYTTHTKYYYRDL